MKVSRYQKWVMGLGLISLVIHWLVPASIVDLIHGNVLFPAIAWLLDHTINLLPFSISYIIVPLLIYMVFRSVWRLFKSSIKKWSTWQDFMIQIFATTGLVVFLFYLFWGFNYDRIQLADRLPWSTAPISKEDFLKEGENQVDRLRAFTTLDRQQMEKNVVFTHYRLLEVVMRNEATHLAKILGYLDRRSARCRQLAPKGILLRLSTAGFYNPFTGECNIDKGLHPLQKPFVMAHEFFHGMGITGEGDCNFLAYVLCQQSSIDYVRYSGELGYWRYMRYSLMRTDESRYDKMMSELPDFVKEDLKSIDDVILKYPDIAPKMRDAIYNAYLKSNKIGDGMANYNRILQLVIAWRKHEKLLN